MAVLPENQRVDIWARVMRFLSDQRQAITISKAQLQAAVNAVDQWVEDNQAGFNAALPAAARNGLTTKQKVLLLYYVLWKRFDVEV